jgi:hypothetical protein
VEAGEVRTVKAVDLQELADRVAQQSDKVQALRRFL